MNRRERILAVIVGVAIGGWLFDSVVLRPARRWFDQVQRDTTAAQARAATAQDLLDRAPQITAQWRSRYVSGLLDDADTARFRLQNLLAQSARDAGLTIESVGGGQLLTGSGSGSKNNAGTTPAVFDILRVTITGSGTAGQLQTFLELLEAAATPLRIERCEMGAPDPRRDQLDLNLTVTTRLLSAVSRSSRALPASAAAWVATPASATLATAIVSAKPFLADRSGSTVSRTTVTRVRSSTVAVERTATIQSPVPGWALVGVIRSATSALAFIRHQSDGRERVLAVGDLIDELSVLSVTDSGMELGSATAATVIAIGYDLQGQPVSIDPIRTGPASSSERRTDNRERTDSRVRSANEPTTTTPLAPTTDAERESILQRLRERRNRNQ